MRIFFDTEFYEDGKTIELISIGLVREDGETYYAELIEAYPYWAKDDWVYENVVKHLKANQNSDYAPEYKTRDKVSKEIVEFVGDDPEFWAYYADYDWVALCQLYGRMIDLPETWPKFCRDLRQFREEIGDPELPEQISLEHMALDDALWNKDVFDFLVKEGRKVWQRY